MTKPGTPLTAEIAVRIAAATAKQIIEALRPAGCHAAREHQMIVAIGRAARVPMPEIDEAELHRDLVVGQIKSDRTAFQASSSPSSRPAPAEAGA